MFDVILADPPWNEHGGGKSVRGAQRHYSLMKTADIIALGRQVKILGAPDSFLLLWATSSFLPDALKVMEAWGYRYVSSAVWVKPRIGLGHYFRMKHEYLLVGVRGRPAYSLRPSGSAAGRRVFPSVIEADRTEHSAKPAEVYDIAEVFGERRLELFARNERPGWESWGFEVTSESLTDFAWRMAMKDG